MINLNLVHSRDTAIRYCQDHGGSYAYSPHWQVYVICKP